MAQPTELTPNFTLQRSAEERGYVIRSPPVAGSTLVTCNNSIVASTRDARGRFSTPALLDLVRPKLIQIPAAITVVDESTLRRALQNTMREILAAQRAADDADEVMACEKLLMSIQRRLAAPSLESMDAYLSSAIQIRLQLLAVWQRKIKKLSTALDRWRNPIQHQRFQMTNLRYVAQESGALPILERLVACMVIEMFLAKDSAASSLNFASADYLDVIQQAEELITREVQLVLDRADKHHDHIARSEPGNEDFHINNREEQARFRSMLLDEAERAMAPFRQWKHYFSDQSCAQSSDRAGQWNLPYKTSHGTSAAGIPR